MVLAAASPTKYVDDPRVVALGKPKKAKRPKSKSAA